MSLCSMKSTCKSPGCCGVATSETGQAACMQECMRSLHIGQISSLHPGHHCCSTLSCTRPYPYIFQHITASPSQRCQATAQAFAYISQYSAACLSSDCSPPQLLPQSIRQGQTSFSSARFCKASGTIPTMRTLGMLSSDPTPTPRSGGPAVNVQMVIHTVGWQHQTAGLAGKGGRALDVPSVQTRRSATTIPCTQRHLIWFLSGVRQTSAALTTSQPAAIKELGGNVDVVVSGRQSSAAALVLAEDVQIVQLSEGASRNAIPH